MYSFRDPLVYLLFPYSVFWHSLLYAVDGAIGKGGAVGICVALEELGECLEVPSVLESLGSPRKLQWLNRFQNDTLDSGCTSCRHASYFLHQNCTL